MKNIVIVNSDIKSLDLYESLLPREFKVTKAVDGLTAVRNIRALKPDLVLSDYDLPLLSGLTLLKFIRSSPKLSGIPFVFISSKPFMPEVMAYGANDWLNLNLLTSHSIIEKIYVHLN